MKIIEQFIEGKRSQKECEDGIVVTPDFIAVIDGSTSKSQYRHSLWRSNGLPYYTALCRAGIPCAYYAYPSGGHGFGFRTTFKYHDQMLHELTTWLNTLKASK